MATKTLLKEPDRTNTKPLQLGGTVTSKLKYLSGIRCSLNGGTWRHPALSISTSIQLPKAQRHRIRCCAFHCEDMESSANDSAEIL